MIWVKGTAMFYALMIVLLISIITSSMLLANELFHKESELQNRDLRLISNCQSGINKLLSDPLTSNTGSAEELDLFGNGTDSVSLKKLPWGFLNLISSTAFEKNHEVSKSYLCGVEIQTTDRIALYLANRIRPLSLCGETRLIGDCFLPEAGVKRGYIGSQAFVGDRLIHGDRFDANRRVPELDPILFEDAKRYLSGQYLAADSLVSFASCSNDSMRIATGDATLVLLSKDSLTTRGLCLEGNVRIVSTTAIFIDASSTLDNVICYAPRIYVDSLFSGCCQLFAEESIHIGSRSHLRYPSALGVQTDLKEPAKIILGNESRVEGCVALHSPEQHSTISIGTNSQVMGQVYSNGMIELKGTVLGSVFTNGILLQTPSSTYENHLLNATIDQSSLPVPFFGINILGRRTGLQPIIEMQ